MRTTISILLLPTILCSHVIIANQIALTETSRTALVESDDGGNFSSKYSYELIQNLTPGESWSYQHSIGPPDTISGDLQVFGLGLALLYFDSDTYHDWEDGLTVNATEDIFPLGNDSFSITPPEFTEWVLVLYNIGLENIIIYGWIRISETSLFQNIIVGLGFGVFILVVVAVLTIKAFSRRGQI